MTEHRASRTLVKSSPELWAQCSDAPSLARHLGQFGEIRITRLEPETSVNWEGEDVRGTVTLEASGWGTKVILTAVADVDPTPAPVAAPDSRGRLARLRLMFKTRPTEARAGAAPAASMPAPPAEGRAELALTQALDSLGQLHHRPFSRA